ncbi:hypothetical protein GOP47_0018972 [Adiantum capillus-veneris]|uniref:Uncharacterized protein n=1 Tax=Adiantum capillus-veneris TaxID=13818 RepID=A0A9D4UF56_ADICA|nr:hypothetical protein GOP47_0018972 [Adiantum capillus-veneris]
MQLPNADHHPQYHPQSSIPHHNVPSQQLASAADDDPLKGLSLDFLTLFSTGHNTAFSDVVFCVEGQQLHAHRCILAARSSFFRMVFCKGIIDTNGALMDASNQSLQPPVGISACLPVQVPVGVVSYDVLHIVLQFLYSGQLILAFQQGRSKCAERGCWHLHCSAHVDLALETLHAAMLFGIDQLSTMIQRHFGSIIDKISIDDVMRVLVTARKQGFSTLWSMCSELVARSGLAMETLKKHLPQEIAAEIEEIRMQRCHSHRHDMLYHTSHSCSPPLSSLDRGTISPTPAARIHKMRQALDSLDIELVRLMVMGEGLDLDTAHALHYSVGNCSRDVVKALLEMGAVNVNHPDHAGRTALHIACEMANPDMISVLLDHHASPLLRADSGDTPIDMIQGLISVSQMGSPTHQRHDHNRLRLCIELLQSAAHVADKEDESSDGAVTEPSSDNTSTRSLYLQHHQPACIDIPDCSSSFEPLNACAANATLATPISLTQDWASIESCPFEQSILTSTDQIEAKHHYQQQAGQDHHPSFLVVDPQREAALMGSKGEPMRDMMNSIDKGPLNNHVMINDNMRTHLQPPSSAPLNCTISSSASTHENFNACVISSNMDDYLYPDFRDVRMVCTQGTLASTVFVANPNSASIF